MIGISRKELRYFAAGLLFGGARLLVKGCNMLDPIVKYRVQIALKERKGTNE